MHLFIVCRGQIMGEIEKCERNKREQQCVFYIQRAPVLPSARARGSLLLPVLVHKTNSAAQQPRKHILHTSQRCLKVSTRLHNAFNICTVMFLSETQYSTGHKNWTGGFYFILFISADN